MCRSYIDVFAESVGELSLPNGYKLLQRGDRDNFNYVLLKDNEWTAYAGWHVDHAPGLIIISNAFVSSSLQGQGLGKKLAQFRVACFHKLRQEGNADGGPCTEIEMICRCNPLNEKQVHILQETGWERISDTLWRVR